MSIKPRAFNRLGTFSLWQKQYLIAAINEIRLHKKAAAKRYIKRPPYHQVAAIHVDFQTHNGRGIEKLQNKNGEFSPKPITNA